MFLRRGVTVLLAASLLVGVVALAGRAGPNDHDGDGMPDEWEESHDLDPNDPSDATEDPDSDHLLNWEEYVHGGDPHEADTDADGLKDGPEVFRWQSDVASANRVVGRVSVRARCRTGDDDCPTKYLFAVEVTLQDSDGETLEKRRTLANGRFTFGDLEPGRYEVSARAVAGTRAPDSRQVQVESDQEEPARAPVRMTDVNGPGLVGQAIQWPTCAAQRKGEDCMAPLADAPIEITDLHGNVLARAVTESDGYYAFELEPGDYKLVAKNVDETDWPHPPRPKRFTVAEEDDGPRVIYSTYDTGIR
jgi:hypothetical protein